MFGLEGLEDYMYGGSQYATSQFPTQLENPVGLDVSNRPGATQPSDPVPLTRVSMRLMKQARKDRDEKVKLRGYK